MASSESPKVILIYLGKRGGGLHLVKMLSNLYVKNGFNVETLMSSKRDKRIEVDGLIYEAGNFNPSDSIRTIGVSGSIAIIKSLFWLYRKRNTQKIWLMSHPLDMPLRIFSKKLNGKNFAVIHEFTPHTGEFWPPKWVSKMHIKLADLPVTLSEFVATEIIENLKKAEPILLPHPTLKISDETKDSILNLDNYFLAIGRIKAYKGLETLAKAWETICNEPELKNWSLVIAGEGVIESEILALPKSIIINKWLEEKELINYVKYCSALVLPYSDASQSGILALEQARKVRKIIFSNVHIFIKPFFVFVLFSITLYLSAYFY
jgi:glycosyltransferase involved in cell wall biosynthesis